MLVYVEEQKLFQSGSLLERQLALQTDGLAQHRRAIAPPFPNVY